MLEDFFEWPVVVAGPGRQREHLMAIAGRDCLISSDGAIYPLMVFDRWTKGASSVPVYGYHHKYGMRRNPQVGRLRGWHVDWEAKELRASFVPLGIIRERALESATEAGALHSIGLSLSADVSFKPTWEGGPRVVSRIKSLDAVALADVPHLGGHFCDLDRRQIETLLCHVAERREQSPEDMDEDLDTLRRLENLRRPGRGDAVIWLHRWSCGDPKAGN